MAKLRIQFVTANPFSAPLRIDEEMRAYENLRFGRSKPELHYCHAARLLDIITPLDENRPNILHFSSHGSPLAELMLLDEAGKPSPVAQQAIQQLFRVYKQDIRLVFLNACYSQDQAQHIAELIDCVIGVGGKIPDESALRFSSQFYRTLLGGKSVQTAYDSALVPAYADRLTPEQIPQLVSPRVDPATVFFVQATRICGNLRTTVPATPESVAAPSKQPASRTSPRPKRVVTDAELAKYVAKKKRHFDVARDFYGISAEAFSVTKIVHPDGSSELHCGLTNLKVAHGELHGLHFAVKSSTGIVSAPILDNCGAAFNIAWKPEIPPPPGDINDVIDRARILQGVFTFDSPLRPGDEPYNFGWIFRILNSDALTVWEYENLYTSDKQVHVNLHKLVPAQEYFTRLVWFPLGRLTITLQLPPGQPAPHLRHFNLEKEPKIPLSEIVADGILRWYPRRDSEWYERNAKWEANFTTERLESSSLRCGAAPSDGVGHSGASRQGVCSELEIEYPLLGSHYSLDWILPNPPVKGNLEGLVREAKLVRTGLLHHRQQRMQNAQDDLVRDIRSVIDEMAERISRTYRHRSPKDEFRVTLVTYDEKDHHLWTVEQWPPAEDPASEDWSFWLPFGIGLAGACFRAGSGAFSYRKSLDNQDPTVPEHYLPLPNRHSHEFLLALPIDHPDLTEEISAEGQRCRQLVAVVTIGSTHLASPLFNICQNPLPDSRLLELTALRDDCQESIDRISNKLLDRESAASSQNSSAHPGPVC